MSAYRSFEAFASTRFGAETSYALMSAIGTYATVRFDQKLKIKPDRLS